MSVLFGMVVGFIAYSQQQPTAKRTARSRKNFLSGTASPGFKTREAV
jgi:hypothetical protein